MVQIFFFDTRKEMESEERKNVSIFDRENKKNHSQKKWFRGAMSQHATNARIRHVDDTYDWTTIKYHLRPRVRVYVEGRERAAEGSRNAKLP